MKKFFTLIAVAMMAVCANAQGTYGVQNGDAGVASGTQEKSVANITMTWGVAGGADFKGGNKKNDVLKDLPEKFERIMSAEMPAAQRKVYDAFKKQAKDAMNANGGKAFDMLPYLTKLRQICVDPGLLLENYHGEAAKLDLLMELVNDYLKEGHRILIFSQFVKALEAIEKRLEIPYFKITGNTDSKIRLKICEDFNNGSEENIVLISLKAGGTGLNLTGADTVIHLDPWWNVSAENQASDRSHRIGQTRNVEVIKLICEDSIEQRVIELQNKKKDLIDRMISNDDSSVVSASLEDIRFILD